MAVLEKTRILPWQKKPTLPSTPKSETAASQNDHPPQESGGLPTKGPPNQTSNSSITSEETSAEVLESTDFTTSACTTEPPSGEIEREATKLSVTTTTDEITSTPGTPNTQGDKVVVVKPPTAAAYKM